jgi:hypothetical protein
VGLAIPLALCWWVSRFYNEVIGMGIAMAVVVHHNLYQADLRLLLTLQAGNSNTISLKQLRNKIFNSWSWLLKKQDSYHSMWDFAVSLAMFS